MKEFVSTGGEYQEGYVRKNIPPTFNMTKNQDFERDGYFFLPGFIENVESIFCEPVTDKDGKRVKGQIGYPRGSNQLKFEPEEKQVPGSLARYNFPGYRQLHFEVRKAVEQVLGIDLLPSYFYDRFYYVGQDLKRHSDRPACEVSVTLQISTNSPNPWPIWFEKPDGTESCVVMKNGDAAIYKGYEREHWRDPLQSKYGKWENRYRKLMKKEDDTYHHQIFLHYVNAQGPFVHHANDTQ